MSKKALAGITVLEYAQMVAAPFCTKLLGLLGAEVLKIEPPGSGDAARRRPPFWRDEPHPERSGLFLYLNTNKQSLTLNVDAPEGRRIFRQLVREADVLVEDTPPGALADLGLGYEALQELNPRLVMTSVTPFGQTGPYAHYKAYDINTFHAGGEGYLLPNGLAYELFPDRPPLKAAAYVSDYHAGAGAAVATLGALCAREIHGIGQHVDVSKQEVQLCLSLFTIQRYLNDGVLENRANRSFKYGDVLPCKDGYVEVLTVEDHQWEALVRMLGDPEWAREERFRDPVTRSQHGDEVNRHLRAWSANFTQEELFRVAGEYHVPLGPYYTTADVVHSGHERARGFFATVDHPETGPLEYPLASWQLSETPAEIRSAAPLLGAHTGPVLQRLGYGTEDLVRLAKAGVI